MPPSATANNGFLLFLIRQKSDMAQVSHATIQQQGACAYASHFSINLFCPRRNIPMKLKPLGDRVIVTPIEADDQTPTGLFLPETAKEKPQQGKVIAAGPGARKEDGDRIAMDINVGDTVLYARYGGTTIKLDGKEYLILKETDVLAIVENGQK
jgi:chaperonin GroES